MPDQVRHVLIIGGSLQATSRGTAGMVRGTIACVRKVCPEAAISTFGARFSRYQHPNLQITIDDGKPVQEYLVFRRHYPALFLKAVCSRFLPAPLRRRFLAANPVLAAYEQADVVLDLTEGDSFSDIYGYWHVYHHYLDKLVAVIYGRPLVLLPQTVGPFKRRLSRFLARWIMRRAVLVCTREPYSTETAKAILGSEKCVAQLADMAFLMRAGEPPFRKYTSDRPLVGVNASDLLYDQPRAVQSLSTGCDYTQLMQTLVISLVTDRGTDILLVPHDYDDGQPESGDMRACKALYRDLPSTIQTHVTVLENPCSAPVAKAAIGQCDFFVGSRLHSCIAAASMRVPVVSLGYSYKYTGVMQGLGMDHLVINLAQDSLEVSLAKTLKAFDERQDICARLQKAVPLVETKSVTCADFLKNQGLL